MTRDAFLLNFSVAGIRQCMFERERDRKGREEGGEREYMCVCSVGSEEIYGYVIF